jgi:hypothetical protein
MKMNESLNDEKEYTTNASNQSLEEYFCYPKTPERSGKPD